MLAFHLKGSTKMNSRALLTICTTLIKRGCVMPACHSTSYFKSRKDCRLTLNLKRSAQSATNHSNQPQRGRGNPFISSSQVLSPQGRDPDIQRRFSLLPLSSDQVTVTRLSSPYRSPWSWHPAGENVARVERCCGVAGWLLVLLGRYFSIAACG